MRTRRDLLGLLGGGVSLGALSAFGYGRLVAGSAEEGCSALVAGSLLRVAESVPGGSVEAHGSAAVARLIREGARDPDAVALADPELFSGVARRATLFATNALVLTYDPESAHADRIETDWRAALRDGAVSLARTDPDIDPLGYRTVMGLRLAEREGWVDAGAVLERAGIHPEVDLLNVVSGGAVDAAFTYRNMAVQRDLPFVDLPAAMDFSDPGLADHYATVSYDLPERTVRGAPIRYAATATTDAGAAWVEALVTGRERLEDAGFAVPEAYPARDQPVG